MPFDDSRLLFWKTEKNRWRWACDKGFSGVLHEFYEERPTIDDFVRKQRKLRAVYTFTLELVDFLVKIAPTLFENLRGVPRWNRYFTALQSTFPHFRMGVILRIAFTLLRLKEVAERIASYTTRLGQSLSVFFQMFELADKYIANLQKGEEVMRSFQRKPQEDLVRLYASYKTFEEDRMLEEFHRLLTKTCSEAITVIVEDIVTLYLMITKDFIEIIVRLPLLERMEEFDAEDDDRALTEKDLAELFTRVADYIRDSEHRNLLSRLLRRASDEAVASWLEEEKEIRRQHPQELRKRFVAQFEQGLILAS